MAGMPEDEVDVEFCRAIAAAIFDDPNKVRFIPLAAKDRFTALQSGEVDVLSAVVVSAAEGWKAQSEEHLAIIELLGILFGAQYRPMRAPFDDSPIVVGGVLWGAVLELIVAFAIVGTGVVLCPVASGWSLYGSSSQAPRGPSAPSIECLIPRTVRKPSP